MAHWYPGHMKKGRRAIRENLSLVDLVLEVVDARIPYTGRNRDLDRLLGEKKRVLVLNKRDLAEEETSKSWIEHYSKRLPVVLLNAKKGEGRDRLLKTMEEMMAKKEYRHIPRVMVTGIPNVGKSLLINLLVRKKKVIVGARPGVTKGKQWIKVEEGFHLLDTPGILTPVLEEGESLYKLAVTSALPLVELDEREVALWLLGVLMLENRALLKRRFNLTKLPEDSLDLFYHLGEGRGFLMARGKVDEHRTAIALLKEFMDGGLGRLTLETPTMLEG